MDRMYLAQCLHAVEEIRHPAPDPLVDLRRLIRDVREQTERRNIIEPAIFAERADVDGERLAVDDVLRGDDRVARESQRRGHIVYRPARNIAERGPVLQLHQSARRFVERPVAAGADDEIIVRAALHDLPREVARPGGRVNRDLIAAGGEDLNDLHEAASDLGVPCVRVDEKQKSLHRLRSFFTAQPRCRSRRSERPPAPPDRHRRRRYTSP